MEIGVPPTVSQPVSITVNFTDGNNNTAPENGTIMRIATTSVEPKPVDTEEYDLYLTEADITRLGLPTENGTVHYYYIRPESSSHTLNFITTSSDVEDLIRFSIDQENGMNQNLSLYYKSAGVKLSASPARFNFDDFTVDDDNTDVAGVKYGLYQPITVSLQIPSEAVQYNDVSFLIKTQNLIPADGNVYPLTPAEGGYRFTIPKGTSTSDQIDLHFLTNRIANGETITINAVDNTALFNPATYTYTNTPIRGTIALDGENPPELTVNSFITLERVNGTRVGIITVEVVESGNIESYRLDLRTEFDFEMEENLTIYYNSLERPQRIYQTTPTFQELVDDASDDGEVGRITLHQQ